MYPSVLLPILLVSVWSVSSQHVRYVLPDGSSPFNCPAQPCLTLDQYTQHTGTYFITGATFLFLAGNHSLQAAVTLEGIANMTLRGRGNESQVGIMCIIQFDSITNITIENLTLVFYTDTSHTDLQALSFNLSTNVKVSDCIFQQTGNNSKRALILFQSSIEILNCVFNKLISTCSSGEAYADNSNITVSRYSFRIFCGGALEARDANITIIGSEFIGNEATYGGAIYARSSHIMISGSKFTRNTAGIRGGAIDAEYVNLTVHGSIFIGNRAADRGGAIQISGKDQLPWPSVPLILLHNPATLVLNGITLFAHNAAAGDGGAIGATDTRIILNNRVNFTSNTAQNGGALFIYAAVSLTLNKHTTLTTSHNHASLYGGAIYHKDRLTSYVCDNPIKRINENNSVCFLRLGDYKDVHINSYFDSAGRDGSFLYGGLLDKCQLSIDGTYDYSIIPYNFLREKQILRVESHSNKKYAVTSQPYTICMCGSPECHSARVSISRGQKFMLHVKAIAQGEVSDQLTAFTSINSRIYLSQAVQTIHNYCTKLEYNFYSTEDHSELRLTAKGSCRDAYRSVQAVIEVTLLPCPRMFIHDNEECACDKRLQEYPSVKCMIDEHNISYVIKKHGTDFWMDISSDINGSYEGLILYKTCPPEYCKTETVGVSLDDLDSQCDDNRGGVLCGQCLDNYSLMLGSSKCRQCSHQHLALLLPFAVAGVALVVFLSFLRLTVATGMINSVILYANILQANRNSVFPVNAKNVLTVFIAWMNLDLGFETCFYDGMTAYAQTWLQFAFPFYVWILISFIILSSRYSITVSKLIGHNPIAVLATLLLTSYTKLLKIIIEVYSSVDLDYPDNQTVVVWLKDANVSYLQSWHLLLTVVTTLVLVLFFLPYTVLLMFGYKFYRFSGRKYFRWFHRIRPLLESYYAPYNIHTRYWTGFLLLVRCALYITFSIYSLGNADKSLLAIIFTFTGLLGWLLLSLHYSLQLYRKIHNDVIEISIYLNLILISTATIIGANTPALVYSLVGLVFVTMLGIIVYHFHLLYIAKSQVWQQFLQVKVKALIQKLKSLSSMRTAAAGTLGEISIPSHTNPLITHTELELSEQAKI